MPNIAPLPADKNKPENDNFYTIKSVWMGKNECNSYIDDASRTFTTITTSGNKCRFFDINGNPVEQDVFTSKYNTYSGEKFLVIMNKSTDEFLIKPLSHGLPMVKEFINEKKLKFNRIL